MPATADLHELISPNAKAREEDPEDVLFDLVFDRLRRDHFVPQPYLNNLISLYCRWSAALGRKACADEANRIIDLAVQDFRTFVPFKHRRPPQLER